MPDRDTHNGFKVKSDLLVLKRQYRKNQICQTITQLLIDTGEHCSEYYAWIMFVFGLTVLILLFSQNWFGFVIVSVSWSLLIGYFFDNFPLVKKLREILSYYRSKNRSLLIGYLIVFASIFLGVVMMIVIFKIIRLINY